MIEYDKEFEVTESQYRVIAKVLLEQVDYREDAGKFFITLHAMDYREALDRILKKF